MTAKELVIQIIADRAENLKSEIETLEEALADKKEEFERLANFLKTYEEFKG